jgi:hypothetical protein
MTSGGLALGDYFNQLQGLLDLVHQKLDPIVDHFHLFGKYEIRGALQKDYKSSLYPCNYLPSRRLDMRSVARVFSCYMTLLECAVAQYQRFHRPDIKSGDDTGGQSPVDHILDACSKELEIVYYEAVRDQRKGDGEAIEYQEQRQNILDNKMASGVVVSAWGDAEAQTSQTSGFDAQLSSPVFLDAKEPDVNATEATPHEPSMSEKSLRTRRNTSKEKYPKFNKVSLPF